MQVDIRKSPLENLAVDTLIVFTAQKAAQKPDSKSTSKGDKGKKLGESTSPQAYVGGVAKTAQERLNGALSDGSVSGSANETVFFRDANFAGARHLLAVGLGNTKAMNHESLRQAVATAIGTLKANKVTSAAIALDTLPQTKMDMALATQALAEGAILSTYAFKDFKEQKEGEKSLNSVTIVSSSKTKDHEKGVEAGRIVAESVNFARWLGDRPGNRMTPTILAEETMKAAKGTALKVTTWGRERIEKEKMGSFLSVSLGSSQEPKLILMEYNGAAKSKKPVCFVGKGLTFDSGGISIKPSAGMEEMKFDMGGGSAVIAAMLAIAKLKLKVNVIAFVPATENMPGPSANKPGDIVIARNGKSIEVNNTDAEGRLILADALVYASEQEPAVIFDAATLTGAMVVALGNLHTGFFTRSNELAKRIQGAADESGEWVWRMPLTDFHGKDMKGTYADLSNTGASRGAGSATAAAFLENFVDKEIPWAHFDVAGTAWNVGDRLPYAPKKGASGSMVRTFVELARSFE